MADFEPLNIEQATGLLSAADPEPAPEPEAAETEPVEQSEELEAQPSAEDAADPEEAIEGEPEDAEEEAQPPLGKPRSWASDTDEVWNGIPREAQEVILARETERDAATDRALSQAAEARKQAEQEVSSVTQLKAALDQILPAATQTFQSKWANWTPEVQAHLARTNPAEYTALDAQFKAEAAQFQRLQDANQQATAVAFREFVRSEGEKLTTLSPELSDPKEGPARKAQLANYLVNEVGVPADQVQLLNAAAIALAYDGMRFRQGQQRLVAPKPAAPSRPAMRPTSAEPVASPQRRAASEAHNRFAQTRSLEDAVRVLDSRAKR